MAFALWTRPWRPPCKASFLPRAVSRLAVLSRRVPAVIRFEPTEDGSGAAGLRHAVPDVGEGEEWIPLVAGARPPSLRVAYQTRFLLHILARAGEKVTYEVGDPPQYGLWSEPPQAWQGVVMPWRGGGAGA